MTPRLRRIILIGLCSILPIGVFLLLKHFLLLKETIQLFAPLFLGAIALFQDGLKKLWSAPAIEVSFSLKFPYCYINEKNQALVRFSITNIGYSTISSCSIYLISISCFKNNSWKKEQKFSPVHLKWTLSEKWKTNKADELPRYVDIYLKEEVFCNLGFMYENPSGFKFERLEEPDSEISKLEKGKYKLEIGIYGKNIQPMFKTFELEWSGEWRDNESKLFGKELKIKLVN